MRFYLRWVNPAVALLILAICSWIYFGGYFEKTAPGEASFGGLIDPDGMSLAMYFFAKGLFCSSTLILLGEVLKRLCRDA